MDAVSFNIQISLGGYIPKFESSGADLSVSSFIRSQKNFKKILKNKKRLNFIVLNLVVNVIIVKFKKASFRCKQNSQILLLLDSVLNACVHYRINCNVSYFLHLPNVVFQS